MARLLNGHDIPFLLLQHILQAVLLAVIGFVRRIFLVGFHELPVAVQRTASEVGAIHQDLTAGGFRHLGQVTECTVRKAVADCQNFQLVRRRDHQSGQQSRHQKTDFTKHSIFLLKLSWDSIYNTIISMIIQIFSALLYCNMDTGR